jgi:hypothetical protein
MEDRAEVRRERKKRDNLSPANVLFLTLSISKISAQSKIFCGRKY